MSEIQQSLIHVTYKLKFISEGGCTLWVAYQLNYVFRIMIESYTCERRGFLPRTFIFYAKDTIYFMPITQNASLNKTHCIAKQKGPASIIWNGMFLLIRSHHTV